MTHKELITQMLEALRMMGTPSPYTFMPDEIERWQSANAAAREYLAAPEQSEPVAKYLGETPYGSLVQLYEDIPKGTELHTHPAHKAEQEPCKYCVQCGQKLMSDFTDTCYACNQVKEKV